jgi:Caspase domain
MVTLSLVLGLLVSQAPAATVRRFALISGANDGGASRVQLRYANSDAKAMAKVLTSLGGVASADVVTLEDPSPQQLSTSFATLAKALGLAKADKTRLEVFFYYSGHSDEEGLLLRGERVSYRSLREKLNALPAEVRVAVLDSCASGALNALKGGAPRPSFLVDSSSSVSGHAFLTSASADESAQESERLKASVFTHFLLSGLRGAADASRDGRVTLGEAYQYAFSETLARTTSTQAGPQRPGWDIQLVGTGDLVLTDVRSADSNLLVDGRIFGRIYVLDAAGGLVVEVAKGEGKPIELGLESGEYKVLVDDTRGHVSSAQLSLRKAAKHQLLPEALLPTTRENTVLRGQAFEPLPVDLALVPPLSFSGMGQPRAVNVGVGAIAIGVGAVKGLLLAGVAAWSQENMLGAAVSGVFLKTGRATGLMLSTLSLSTGDVTGAQLGVGNIAAGRLTGTQLGVVNVAGDGSRGFQGSVLNMLPGAFSGAQLGVVNIGGEVVGLQAGVVNIATRVSGTQIGVVNVAQNTTAPIGLVNVMSQGEFHLAAWASESQLANIALKLGSKNVYSFIEAGVNPRGFLGQATFSAGLGLGVRIRPNRWYGELEASALSFLETDQLFDTQAFAAGLRLHVGYQVTGQVAVFAGPQVQTVIELSSDEGPLDPFSPWGFSLSRQVSLVPGIVIGAQFF